MPTFSRRTLATAVLLAAALGSAHAQDIQARTIKFPSASNKGHPQVWGVEKFAELVAQKSGGKLKVQNYPGGTLGPDLQVVSAMQGGTVEMNVMNASLLAGNVKEMALFDMPFLVASPKEADALMDGPIGRQLLDKLQERGLVGLAYFDLGFRHIHTVKKPIDKADDFKGLKMRVIPTPIYVETMKALGANPVPMPFTETYQALETGAIDGMTNPLLNILDGKYNEVSKHLTLTGHMYTPQAVIVSKKFWDKLSPAEQKILRDAAQEAAPQQRRVAREAAAKVLAEIKAKGMQVHELPPAELAKIRERVQPVVDKFTGEIGAPMVKAAQAEIAAARR